MRQTHWGWLKIQEQWQTASSLRLHLPYHVGLPVLSHQIHSAPDPLGLSFVELVPPFVIGTPFCGRF